MKNICIQTITTLPNYADYAWRHLVSSEKIGTDSRISAFFKDGIGVPEIEEFFVRWNERQTQKKGIYISYDSTNMNTTAQGIDMVQVMETEIINDVIIRRISL